MKQRNSMLVSILLTLLFIGGCSAYDTNYSSAKASRVFNNEKSIENSEEAKEAFLKYMPDAVTEMIPAKMSYLGGSPEGGSIVVEGVILDGWVPSSYGSVAVQDEKFGYHVSGFFVSREGNIYQIMLPQ